MDQLLELTDRGLYCVAGDFYIDPWLPVARAVVTHGHGDHARPGSGSYLTASAGVPILRIRFGDAAKIDGLAYGETVTHNGVRISLHPAGHILGSAQVRIELGGRVCVVSGDYKLEADPTCEPFESVRCHRFVTESTFGLPIYRWRPPHFWFDEINAWWRRNQTLARTSVIYSYSLGKSQRILAGVDHSIGPILLHGAVESFVNAYRAAGIALPDAPPATTQLARQTQGNALVIAPPSASGTPWLRKFGDVSQAVPSGWMQIRGTRRRRAIDRGFVLSDHADWDGLLWAIRASQAEEVWVTHGFTNVMARWLAEQGIHAKALRTPFKGETPDMSDESDSLVEHNPLRPSDEATTPTEIDD